MSGLNGVGSLFSGAGSLITDLFGANNSEESSGTASATGTSTSYSSQISANSSAQANISQLISSVIQTVTGSSSSQNISQGGTTSNTNSSSQTVNSANPDVIATDLSLAQGEIANANGTGTINTNNLVNNIFTQALNAFAPVLGQATQSGVYNSASVASQATNAEALATGQAASAVLGFDTTEQQQAGGILGQLLTATSSSKTNSGSSTDTSNYQETTDNSQNSQTTSTLTNQLTDALQSMFSGSRTDNYTNTTQTQQQQQQTQSSGNSGGASIVCTELMKQGKLSKADWKISMRHFMKYREDGRDAYYLWATPLVKELRSRPNSIFSSIICWIFNRRANYIAGRNCTSGYIIAWLMWLLCAAIVYVRKLNKFLSCIFSWRIA